MVEEAREMRPAAPNRGAPRAPGPEDNVDVLARFGPFELRPCGTLVTQGRVVPLTPKEESVLRLLVRAEGRRVSKGEIIAAVWSGVAGSDSSLTRAIHTLRRRLGEGEGGACYIRTSYGRGYQLAVPVRREPDDRSAARRVGESNAPSPAPGP
jgi:DNA-binding winged helix-turn-helix (wHTH) protein